MSLLGSVVDNVLGERPPSYDLEDAMEEIRRGTKPAERRKLAVHADACHVRQVENKWMFSQLRNAQYRDRKLQIIAVVLIGANLLGIKLLDLGGFISALLSP